jgi:hypothetical protein
VPGRSEHACLSTPRPEPALPLAGCGISCPATATCAKGVCLCPAGERAAACAEAAGPASAQLRPAALLLLLPTAACRTDPPSPAPAGENLVPIAYDNGYLNQRCVRAQCAALDPAAGLRVDNVTFDEKYYGYATFSLGVRPLTTASNSVSKPVEIGQLSNSVEL